jgi:hypothetical protein
MDRRTERASRRGQSTESETHNLSLSRAVLDVHDKLLLLLFKLAPLAVEFALRLLQRPLVLPQPLGRSLCTSEERFLRS